MTDTEGDPDPASLMATARDALSPAYVPYSDYRVGAALRAADGSVYAGCNVENANYSNSLHAEEVAVGRAVADGRREFDAIAVVSGARDGVTPCGMCRQTLAEFCGDEFPVFCDENGTIVEHALGDLLPAAISPATLSAAAGADAGGDGDGDGTADAGADPG